MDAVGVDPRDVQWEQDSPVYRVYFWRSGAGANWSSDESRITGASDVEAVLSWASDQADGRVVVVYAETTDRGQLGLLRLLGEDPLDASARSDFYAFPAEAGTP